MIPSQPDRVIPVGEQSRMVHSARNHACVMKIEIMMRFFKCLIFLGVVGWVSLASIAAQDARPEVDSLWKSVELLPATVAAVQMPERIPYPSLQITAAELAKRDASMDLPYLLRFTPSLVVTSDAGTGIGYTSMRVRGSDQTHINVTLNGVALNDAESHQVYWVDLPDLSSSVDNLSIQRGVGSSSNGPGAFAASVAINTLKFDAEPRGKLVLGGGAFHTQRAMVSWSTGQMGSGLFAEGRASRILSDGFMDRSAADLSSFQVGLGYKWNSGHLAFTSMLGHERTQQAWYGVPKIALEGSPEEIWDWAQGSYEYGYGQDSIRITDLIENGRRHNYYQYDGQVDDYRQDHHQVHLDQSWAAWKIGVTGHYTKGAGYYEQFRENDDFALYGVPTADTSLALPTSGVVIRRRWLDNDFLGGSLQASRHWENLSIQLGGGAFGYSGDHFGVPIWMQWAGLNLRPDERYYDNTGIKNDRYGFAMLTRKERAGAIQWRLELQARQVDYRVNGVDQDQRTLDVDTAMFFVNPKGGLDWICSENHRVFFSVARGNREPVRTDFIDRSTDAYPLSEQLTDFETGWEFNASKWSIQSVLYYMRYRNQLVLTGALNDVGAPIRQNVDRSYRAGLECTVRWNPIPQVNWYGTATFSQNRIEEFTETLFDYADGFEPVVFVEHELTDISFSPNLTASSVLTWEFWNRLSSPSEEQSMLLEWSARYVGKQYLDNTSNDQRSLDPYAINDFRLRWIKAQSGGTIWSVSGFLRNALNSQFQSNGWTYSYLYGGLNAQTTEVYVYPQAGMHFMLSIELEF